MKINTIFTALMLSALAACSSKDSNEPLGRSASPLPPPPVEEVAEKHYLVLGTYDEALGRSFNYLSTDEGETYTSFYPQGLPVGGTLQAGSGYSKGKMLLVANDPQDGNILKMHLTDPEAMTAVEVNYPPEYAPNNHSVIGFKEGEIAVRGGTADYAALPSKVTSDFGQTYTDLKIATNTSNFQKYIKGKDNTAIQEFDMAGVRTYYLSKDGGQNYEPFALPPGAVYAFLQDFNKDLLIFNTYEDGYSNQRFYVSTDLGQTYQVFGAELADMGLVIQKAIIAAGGRIFVQASRLGMDAEIYLTSDRGLTFKKIQVPAGRYPNLILAN